jgi:hypothetical protein
MVIHQYLFGWTLKEAVGIVGDVHLLLADDIPIKTVQFVLLCFSLNSSGELS